MGWRKKLNKAKKRHRPSLKNWERDKLADPFRDFVQSLSTPEAQNRFFRRLSPYNDPDCKTNNDENRKNASSSSSIPLARGNIPVVVDGDRLTQANFATHYEAKEIPLVIRNIPSGCQNGLSSGGPVWNAMHHWSLDALAQSHLRDRLFKCGEDDDGRSIKVKLKHFLKYLHQNRDDSPLYIFDSRFDDDPIAQSILTDYHVPSYFEDDLFQLVSEKRRPPYRWFLVGPERSGTCIHVDPLGTNAWNTLLHGTKRWVLFPPHVPKRIVKGHGLVRRDEDDEAIHYFMFILPRIQRHAQQQQQQQLQRIQSSSSSCCASAKIYNSYNHHHNHNNNNNNSNNTHKSHPDDDALYDYHDFAVYEFTQHAGETVFVPHGWWHAVLNLTHTVGITQNYCSPRNFDSVWTQTRSGRPRMAYQWLCALERSSQHPELAQRAQALNERDQFRMKYDPVEIEQREIEKRSSMKQHASMATGR